MTKASMTRFYRPKLATVRREVARWLLDIKAVRVCTGDDLFTLTSGRQSPIYTDCRCIIGHVAARRCILGHARDLLDMAPPFDAVAGGETAGIPYAAWIAEILDLPMMYVRKKPKGFGANKRIEGIIQPGQQVLLVEDLATDGGSKIGFANAIREADAFCNNVLVIFYYGESPKRTKAFIEHGLSLFYLCTWDDVLEEVKERNLWPQKTQDRVRAYLDDTTIV